MIKNIQEMSTRQLKEFQSIYAQYFKETFIYDTSNFPTLLSYIIDKKRCQMYVAEMINRIRQNTRNALISIDDVTQMVDGFIVGGISAISHEAFIVHSFSIEKDPIKNKLALSKLYKAFIQLAKMQDVTIVKNECLKEENDLKNLLEGLGFATSTTSAEATVYCKALESQSNEDEKRPKAI